MLAPQVKKPCPKRLSVCTDGAPTMIGKVDGAVALLKGCFGRSLLKYHCIIHQDSLCGKFLVCSMLVYQL